MAPSICHDDDAVFRTIGCGDRWCDPPKSASEAGARETARRLRRVGRQPRYPASTPLNRVGGASSDGTVPLTPLERPDGFQREVRQVLIDAGRAPSCSISEKRLA